MIDCTPRQIRELVRSHFDALARSYDDKCSTRRVYLDAIDRLIVDDLAVHNRPLRVLDVGCGTGRRTERYRAQLRDARVYGCDLSAAVLDLAKNRVVDGLVRADMVSLPFRSQSVDVVISLFNAFGYVPDRLGRLQTLLEFNRVLPINGMLFMDVMNRWHLGEGVVFKRNIAIAIWQYIRALADPALCVGDLLFVLEHDSVCIPGWVHGFSRGEVVSLLRRAGFIISKSLIVGYDTGSLRPTWWQGQLFYIARKASNTALL
jgi:ubiquinone/menaquinone biosynthesis C-methylase UbiE